MQQFITKNVQHFQLLYLFQTRGRHYITTYDDGNKGSKVNFKCTAKIGNGYWQSVEEETIVKRQVLPLESRSSASSGMCQKYLNFNIVLRNRRYVIQNTLEHDLCFRS